MGCTVIWTGFAAFTVPLEGCTVNKSLPCPKNDAELKVSVDLDGFVTAMVWGAGSAPPCWATKTKPVG